MNLFIVNDKSVSTLWLNEELNDKRVKGALNNIE